MTSGRKTEEGIAERKTLELLFEIDLEYKEGKTPVHRDGKVGEYIGSGEGRVEGRQIQGEVHWTLFEHVDDQFCRSNLFGVITTDDGAEIRFDTLGYFLVPEREATHLWVTSAAVRFETEDERYAWLNPVLGVWEGEFDMQTYHHYYRAYIRRMD